MLRLARSAALVARAAAAPSSSLLRACAPTLSSATTIARRAGSSKAAAAAAAPNNAAAVASLSLPALPATQLRYITSADLQSKGDAAALQAVAVFLTEEELAALLSSAGEAAELSVEALVGAEASSSAPSLFAGAVTHGPSSGAWADFKAKAGETLWIYPSASSASAAGKKAAASKPAAATYPRVLLVGLGASASVKLSSYRSAAWKAISSFQSCSLSSRVGLLLPQPAVAERFFDSHLSAEIVAAVARVAALSNHSYWQKYLSKQTVDKKKKVAIAQIDLIDLAPPAGAADAKKGARVAPVSPASMTAALARRRAGIVLEDRATVIRHQSVIARAVCLAREFANERGDVATPAWMEQQARAVAARHPNQYKLTVLQDSDLDREGLQMIRAVGQAGKDKSRIIMLEYKGGEPIPATALPSAANAAGSKAKDAAAPAVPLAPITALVGKGVTFDTGGLLIKGRGNMEGMHLDKSGSCAVLAVMSALPDLGYRGHVVGVLALAENAIGSGAFKPLAILPSAAGSVEIIDTDAEGRLVLADALTYVQRVHRPARIIDLATLTGASVVALGEHRAALFSNDPDPANDAGLMTHSAAAAAAAAAASAVSAPGSAPASTLASELISAGNRTGERVWRLPIDDDHRDALKGTYADLKNCAVPRWGGASVAAAFLEKYIDKGAAWAHVDLAGPAMLSKPNEWQPEGGTGFGTQLVLEYLQQHERTAGEESAVEKIRQTLAQFKESDLGPQQE